LQATRPWLGLQYINHLPSCHNQTPPADLFQTDEVASGDDLEKAAQLRSIQSHQTPIAALSLLLSQTDDVASEDDLEKAAERQYLASVGKEKEWLSEEQVGF